MRRLRTFQEKLLAFFLLIFALTMHAGVIAAQQAPKPRASVSPRLIILPPKVSAGEPAMLAVLDSRGRLMPKIEVEISGGQKVTTDVTGRALFNATSQPGRLVAKIAFQRITATTTVVPPETVASPGSLKSITVSSYPHVMTQHDRFVLEGAGFQSLADSNHISVNGEPCLTVASSPVSIVLLPGPRIAVGEAKLRIESGGADGGSFPVSVVALEISGPSDAVNAGSSGTLSLSARGSILPLTVEVRNLSPQVIRLTQGNVQRIKTSGGDQNTASIEVSFLTGGNYIVLARLVSSDTRRN